jgi:hypothetical protein
MAGLMDIFGGGDIYGDLLSEEQKKRMQQQTMMTMAAKLLQAGGPSTTPTNLGQAIGGAYLSGQEAYSQAGQNALTQMLTKQKIDEYKREQAQRTAWANAFGLGDAAPTGAAPATATSAPITPTQAMSAPNMRLGPTTQRAAMIGQTPAAGMPTAAGGTPLQQAIQSLTPAQRSLISGMTPKQGMEKMFDILSREETWQSPVTEMVNGMPMQVRYSNLGNRKVVEGATPFREETWGAPVTEMRNGQPVRVSYSNLGESKVVSGAGAYESPTGNIKDYEYAKQQGYKGTFQQFQKEAAEAGATKIPGGQTPIQLKVDEKFAQEYVDWKSGGQVAAARNISQVTEVLNQIMSGQQVSGPLMGVMPDFITAITNPAALDAQERVAQVVQGSLRETLGAQFTEKEGQQIIARAFNPKLDSATNARRLAYLMQQIKQQAASKQAMVDYVDEFGTLKGYTGPKVDPTAFYDRVMSELGSMGVGGAENPAAKFFK